MVLNKQKGNMYGFVSHTWNTIKGECPHGCEYCYMKRWGNQKPVRFDEKELDTDLSEGHYIFVGSSCDMWADKIPQEWIDKTLEHCERHPNNKYLFQSKNPARMSEINIDVLKVIVCVTIESNRWYPEMGKSIPPVERILVTSRMPVEKEITIEPIMDFDIKEFVRWIKIIETCRVNIGANSWSKIKLVEPPKEKILEFISELEKFTEVHRKPNLARLLSTDTPSLRGRRGR